MKADVSIKRVAAFAKRLLQVALHSPAPFAAGILFLLSEVLKVLCSYQGLIPHCMCIAIVGDKLASQRMLSRCLAPVASTL